MLHEFHSHDVVLCTVCKCPQKLILR
jgi:hypothetical protein